MSDDQIKSIIERVQRLQEEKRTIEDDIKEVYAEARANGYDVKVLRAVVKHLGKDRDEVAEFDAIFDLYMQAYEQASRTVSSRAHMARNAGAREARSNTETAAPDLPPSVQDEAETGERPEQGSAARSAGGGVGIVPEHADQFVAPTGGEVATIATESPSAADVRPIRRLPAPPIDLTIPAFLDRRIPKPEARQ